MSLMKKCKGCPQKNLISDFPIIKSRGKEYISGFCSECMRKKQKSYRDKNKIVIKQRNSLYYDKIKSDPEFLKKEELRRDVNKIKKKEYDKIYRSLHKEDYKQYCIENKENISKNRNEYYLEHKEERKIYNKDWEENNRPRRIQINTKAILKKLKTNISFKIRSGISHTIRRALKNNNSSKNGKSILKYLLYTIQELKEHLEKQFEPWMNWNNYGVYKRAHWNDNDQATWTWNIDHIIPQSQLLYSSMEDDNFKKCWALENIRPYSSKQNLLDGITRVRHNGETN